MFMRNLFNRLLKGFHEVYIPQIHFLMECEHGSGRSVGTVKIIHSMNWDRTASQGVRNVTWVNALASFDRHKHSVLSSETFRCLESGTFHHSRDFWFQIQRSANEVYNQAWLSESLDFGKTGSVLPKFCIYTSWNPLRFDSVFLKLLV